MKTHGLFAAVLSKYGKSYKIVTINRVIKKIFAKNAKNA